MQHYVCLVTFSGVWETRSSLLGLQTKKSPLTFTGLSLFLFVDFAQFSILDGVVVWPAHSLLVSLSLTYLTQEVIFQCQTTSHLPAFLLTNSFYSLRQRQKETRSSSSLQKKSKAQKPSDSSVIQPLCSTLLVESPPIFSSYSAIPFLPKIQLELNVIISTWPVLHFGRNFVWILPNVVLHRKLTSFGPQVVPQSVKQCHLAKRKSAPQEE